MRRFARFTRLIVLLGVMAAACFAQQEKKEGGEGNIMMWKWANFLVLAGALGYLIGKNAPPFFKARSAEIRRDMDNAAEERRKAEERVAAVELRLANLETEIAALHTEAQQEVQIEAERLAQHTAAEIAKIQARAEQEIVFAGKAARIELKRYAAELAVGLAEQKIRARMTPDVQDVLVRGFVRDLK
jgi:F-type H+-transporting ATPase subunit b